MRKIINFKKIQFVKTKEKLNAPDIDSKKKKRYYKEFLKNCWFNGELKCIKNYKNINGKIIIKYGKSNFFDFLINYKKKNKIYPLIAVNGVINVEDSIILIKRGKDVFSCSGWFDFPAGIVKYDENLRNRLINRIKEDTSINSKDITFKELIPYVILIKGYFSVFYPVNYKKSGKELESLFNKKFKENKPILVNKKDIKNFIKKNKVVFPEILERI